MREHLDRIYFLATIPFKRAWCYLFCSGYGSMNIDGRWKCDRCSCDWGDLGDV